jgi:hypothetical protein
MRAYEASVPSIQQVIHRKAKPAASGDGGVDENRFVFVRLLGRQPTLRSAR